MFRIELMRYFCPSGWFRLAYECHAHVLSKMLMEVKYQLRIPSCWLAVPIRQPVCTCCKWTIHIYIRCVLHSTALTVRSQKILHLAIGILTVLCLYVISIELDNGRLFSQKYVIFWDHVRGLDRCETKVKQKQESFLAKTHTHTQTWVGICGLILHPLRKFWICRSRHYYAAKDCIGCLVKGVDNVAMNVCML